MRRLPTVSATEKPQFLSRMDARHARDLLFGVREADLVASRGLVDSAKVKGIRMSNDELAIRNLVDTWCRATEAGDVDALAPLMADDMVFLTPGGEPFGKREFLEASRQSAGNVTCSVQADVVEVRVAGDLGYCWLKLAVTVTPPDGAPPMQHAGPTIGIYRREGGRWVLARDANLVL